MGRSLKKGPFVSQKLLAKIDAQLESGDRKPIKTWSRASMITPDFVGLTFLVHAGKNFATVYVTENMATSLVNLPRLVSSNSTAVSVRSNQ